MQVNLEKLSFFLPATWVRLIELEHTVCPTWQDLCDTEPSWVKSACPPSACLRIVRIMCPCVSERHIFQLELTVLIYTMCA
jgi:hypothetical protein